jgi:hypothetical protein
MRNNRKKLFGLTVLAGLVIAFVRHIIERTHWGWDGFFLSWFVHMLAVGLLLPFAGAAIFAFHKIILGYEFEAKESKSEEVIFAVLMTIIIAAVFTLLIAIYWPDY